VGEARSEAHARFHDAVAAAQSGRLDIALTAIEAAIALDARAVYRFARADFLESSGRLDDALHALQELVRTEPDFAPARTRLTERLTGRACEFLAKRDAPAAEVAAQEALAIDPAFPQAHAALGHALQALGAHTRAEAHFARTAAANPDSAPLWLTLANARLNIGRIPQALEAFDRAAALVPADVAQIESARLLAMHYDDRTGNETMFRAHLAWASRHADVGAAAPPRAVAADRALRIGYVSPRMHRSSPGNILALVLEHHDRAAFETFCYACSDIEDAVTLRMRASTTHWRHAWELDDRQLAQLMRDDGIDIAVDLAGHTPGHRLCMFAHRPAPVAVAWLDYFNTTGVGAIDAFVTDRWHSPPGDQQKFTEALVRVPGLRLCWEPPAGAPATVPPPALANREMVFGSFNRISKLSASTVDAWTEVLRAVPDSRLVVKSGSLDNAEEHPWVRERFEERGVDPRRIECRGQSPYVEMLRQYGDIDIALDSFPYNGGIVTLEALWMGRPVLTLRGDSLISRQSAAILACAGLDEWIARDVDEFVAIAARHAADRQLLSRACASIRAKVAASPITDAAGFTRGLESRLREVWLGKVS
jgi:protein O-GlcNAc transferase